MKTSQWLITGVLLTAMAAWAAGAAPVKVKVLKNSVNLRAKPLPEAEVVGQAAANDILGSKSISNEWVEIIPPTNVDLWVLGDYVKNGVIQGAQKVNVRSGPGINFATVGKLASGDAVTLRSTMKEWVRIAPPESCSLWVSRSLVQVAVDPPPKPEPPKPEPAKIEPPKAEPATNVQAKAEPAKPAPAKKAEEKSAVKPASAAERAPVPVSLHSNVAGAVTEQAAAAAPAKPAAGVEPPADLLLVPSVGQGQWKQYEGILRPRGIFARTPSRYRLVVYDKDGNGKTVCYVKGNNDQLSTLINRPMIISGREYWVLKQTYPVLVPDRIVLK